MKGRYRWSKGATQRSVKPLLELSSLPDFRGQTANAGALISGDKQVSCSLIPTLPRSERDGHGGMGNDGSDKQQGSRQRNRGGLSCKVVIFGKGAGESSEQPLGMALRKGAKGEAVVAAPPPRGSLARRAGVAEGDTILGVNACRTSDFNQILWLLKRAERPMHLLLLPKHSGATPV